MAKTITRVYHFAEFDQILGGVMTVDPLHIMDSVQRRLEFPLSGDFIVGVQDLSPKDVTDIYDFHNGLISGMRDFASILSEGSESTRASLVSEVGSFIEEVEFQRESEDLRKKGLMLGPRVELSEATQSFQDALARERRVMAAAQKVSEKPLELYLVRGSTYRRAGILKSESCSGSRVILDWAGNPFICLEEFERKPQS
jgi:hypothetical protein